MSATIPFKRLILRAALRDVSPIVARPISVSDDTELSDLHDILQHVSGWNGDLGYSLRIQWKTFNSFRGSPAIQASARVSRSSRREVPLHLRLVGHLGVQSRGYTCRRIPYHMFSQPGGLLGQLNCSRLSLFRRTRGILTRSYRESADLTPPQRPPTQPLSLLTVSRTA